VTPTEFAAKWSGSTRTERAASQEHFIDLCRLLKVPTPNEAERIAEAARELDRLRQGWLNPPGLSDEELAKRTLTNLYNQRPQWLADVHARLDAAVLDAYGWPADIADDDLLACLLELNLERSAAQPGS